MAKKSDKAAGNAKRDLLVKLRKHYAQAVEADNENRDLALDDIRFVNEPGSQWEADIKKKRGRRPCYEFNKLRVTCKRIINDMRMNRPAGKVRAVEANDEATAEVFEGLCRNVWNVSDGDTVIDQAGEFQVAGGMAAWRVTLDYSDDSGFDQEAKVEGFKNPFVLWADPACQDPLYRDARFWFVSSKMARDAFDAKYPDAQASSFEDSEFDDDDDWDDGESVRVVEYWYKVPVTKTLYLTADGRTVEETDGTHVQERVVRTHKIRMCVASANAILEEADWIGSQFPFVMIHGERMSIEGRNRWWGVVRFAKDAQRGYNASRTAAIETVALAPQAKFWATPEQAKGHTTKWGEAHHEALPFMLYNADPKAPGPPARMPAADVPAALVQEMMVSSEDIKAITGIFDPSLGNRSNETTGVAIRQRQAQGEIVTFNYQDNLAKGIRRTWEILVDLLPRVYDRPRMVRILGVDGVEKFEQINGVDPVTNEVVNDITRGKFDVTVTTGPSFATQRQEAAETYLGLAQAVPGVFDVAGDLLFRAMDLPYSDQIAERIKTMLPPQIQALEQSGGQMPPEVAAAMQQVDMAMQQVAQMEAQLQQAAAEVETERAGVEKAKAELSVQKAQMQADYQKVVADITKRETAFTLQQAQAGADENGKAVAADREALGAQVQQALATIQQQAAQYMQQAAGVLAQVAQAGPPPQVVVANPPKRKRVVVERVNGKLVGEVQEVSE